MQTEPNSFQTGLSDRGLEILKRRLVDLVEPLNDHQLLDLADGIHEMLRQRRAVRQSACASTAKCLADKT